MSGAGDCTEDNQKHTVTCCWNQSSGIDSVLERYCQTCRVYPDQPTDCDSTVKQGIAPPPSGRSVAPPPSTTTCPENTALDANGNCAPVTQGPKESPPSSTDQQGITQPPDNTPSSKQKLPRGGDLLETPPSGDNIFGYCLLASEDFNAYIKAYSGSSFVISVA